MADTTQSVKRLKVSVTPQLFERELLLREEAKKRKVTYDLSHEMDAAISKVLDRFEMYDMAAAGHQLSPELAEKRRARDEATKLAAQTLSLIHI